LNPDDRFELVAFNESPDPLFGELVPAGPAQIERATARADQLSAEGGTNIAAALAEALSLLGDDGRPGYVVFLTDGRPTVGERDVNRILTDTAKAAPSRARLFVFGVGYDVNTTLLDGLSSDIRGFAQYVRPGEDLEVPVSNLARRISYPVLTDLKLEFAGIEPYDVYPRKLGDIFRGSQILVSGRLRGGSRAAVTLSGTAQGEREHYSLRQDLSKTRHEEFVALLWANRKVGFLIDEIRRQGQSQELVDEVVRLSKKFGIINEYTSFLVREPDIVFGRRGAEEARESFMAENADKLIADSGGSAVNQSINSAGQKYSLRAPTISDQSYYDAAGRTVSIGGVTNVGRRVFFRKDDTWVENTYVEDQEVLEIERYSAAQFQLVELDPALGRLMALGENVLFLVNGRAVKIGDTGAEQLTETELRDLF
jgi:Ca-activated chloride channel family protein